MIVPLIQICSQSNKEVISGLKIPRSRPQKASIRQILAWGCFVKELAWLKSYEYDDERMRWVWMAVADFHSSDFLLWENNWKEGKKDEDNVGEMWPQGEEKFILEYGISLKVGKF